MSKLDLSQGVNKKKVSSRPVPLQLFMKKIASTAERENDYNNHDNGTI